MDTNSMDTMTLITGIYIALSALGFLIALWITFILVRKLVRLFSTGGVFGDSGKAWIIGLGMAVVVFPRVLPTFVGTLISFIFNFFIGVPKWLFASWQEGLIGRCQDTATEAAADCMGLLSFSFFQAWATALSDAYSSTQLASLPYGKLVLLLAVWALVAQLFSQVEVRQEGTETSQKQMWLGHAFSRIAPVTRQNLIFFLILAIAGYLSIASIATIPGLQGTVTVPTAVSPEKLEQRLDEMLGQSEGMLTEKLERNPFTSLEEALAEWEDKDDPAYEKVEKLLAYHKSGRQEFIGSYSTLFLSAQAQKSEAKSAALTHYQAGNVNQKGMKEGVEHFLMISDWVRSRVSSLDSRLLACEAALDSADAYWQNWADQMQPYLTGQANYEALSFALPMPPDVYIDLRQDCQSRFTPGSAPPDRPPLGSNLGPFSFVAGWLLRTESLPLTLIIGLLGFGLLGSAISSVVREQVKKTQEGALVKDLPRMVIRGLSAAIVVFLAVEGGLAVFTSGEGEPNPYVLLFTCFVAAVFSEVVWQWAHERLEQMLGEDGEEDDKDKSPQPADEPKPKPTSTTGDQPQTSPPTVDKPKPSPKEETTPKAPSPPEEKTPPALETGDVPSLLSRLWSWLVEARWRRRGQSD